MEVSLPLFSIARDASPPTPKREDLLDVSDLRPHLQKRRSLSDLLIRRRQLGIVFAPDKCSGCGTCEMICSARNGSEVSPASASIQVLREEEKGKTFAIFCQHCRKPICLEICPTKAIAKDGDGIVSIEHRLCVACGLCTLACPEAAPLVDPRTQKIHKCDLCGGDPLCVNHCPENALSFSSGKATGWLGFLRWPVQFASFLLLVIILVGTFCSLRVAGLQLSCPVGALQNIASSGAVILVGVASALILVIMTGIAGRIFCGWICPFGFILDLVGKLTPKLGWPSFLRSRMTKYGVLAASLGGSYALGFQVFCTICPIGTICRSYGIKEVFRGYELAVIPVFAGLEIGGRRTWCRYFCPVGAFLALVAKVGLIKVVIGAKKCKKFSCMRCAEVCPMGIIDKNFLREGISPKLPTAECILCLRCMDQCPYGAAKVRFRFQKAIPQEV